MKNCKFVVRFSCDCTNKKLNIFRSIKTSKLLYCKKLIYFFVAIFSTFQFI